MLDIGETDTAATKQAKLNRGSAVLARPYPVQRLQIELLIGLGWNKARRRSLHGLGHSMSISKVILVSLPKRLRICRRNLLHIVAKRCKLPSNVVCCHPRFDTNQAGWLASLDVMRPRETRSRNTMAPNESRPTM
jgi:hypothetical protein